MANYFVPTYEGFIKAHLENSKIYDELTYKKVVQENAILKTINYCSPNVSVIANMASGQFIYVRGSEKVIGIEAQKIIRSFDMLESFNRFHPEDARLFSNYVYLDIVNFLKTIHDIESSKYRFTVCIRYLHFGGYYIHLLQHIICLSKNKDGWPLNTIIIGSDISHFKRDNNLILTITRVDTEGERLILKKEYEHNTLSNIFTPREIQIIALLKKGLPGKQIAELLFISENTLKNHKSNMMEKVNASNTIQLLDYCENLGKLVLGWILYNLELFKGSLSLL